MLSIRPRPGRGTVLLVLLESLLYLNHTDATEEILFTVLTKRSQG